MNQGTVRLEGGCHCGDHRYLLEWPAGTNGIPARRCGCSFCTRMGGTWTSHPQARLTLLETAGRPASRYQFGTGTADFMFCARCGIAFAVTCIEGDWTGAVININSLDDTRGLDLELSDSNFAGESTNQRLARRRERWIGHVSIELV